MQILKPVFLGVALLGYAAPLQAESLPDIDPQADQFLQAVGAYLAEAEQFTFQAEVIVDEFSPRGQKIQYSHLLDVSVSRPDGLKVDQVGDLLDRSFWFDGDLISILERPLNLYASLDAPDTIDAALDFIYERFGVSPPLSDLVVSNPYDSVIANVQTGDYVGLHQVRDQRCHHLAFTQEMINWQLWVQDGEQVVPCKLVITYKALPDSPQYVAYFSSWDFDVALSDSLFTFEAPEDGFPIEFLPVPTVTSAE
jgi:hypothetical protein